MSRRRLRRFALVLLLLPCLSAAAPIPDDFGPVGDFALTERSGRTVRPSDLLGKVWVASFIFTRCTAGCPQVSTTIQKLQTDLARSSDVRFVTFTVDPRYDNLQRLNQYAQRYKADPERWLFLTGEEEEIYALLDKTFHLPAHQNEGAERTEGNEVAHSTKLVLVDRRGHIRGYFDGMPLPGLPAEEAEAAFQKNLKQLKGRINDLEYEAWYLPADFPRFNASLNALAAVLLIMGYAAIRRRLAWLHITCMLSALGVSALFLASYLYYHIIIRHGQATSFAEQTSHASPPPWVGQAYLFILLTHTVLAAVAAPLAVYTAYEGLTGQLMKHMRIARWTLPIWLYVSITGVVVYWMLYRLYPSP